MHPRTGRTILITLSLIGTLVAANVLVFSGRPGHWLADWTGNLLVPVTDRVAWLRAYSAVLAGGDDRVLRIAELTRENEALLARLASTQELERDIAFYRTAAQLRPRPAVEPVEAGVFAWPRAGGVRQLIANRGTNDDVRTGDVVVTSAGVLVGTVREAHEDHAVITAVSDPLFEVTGRVMDTDITGLVRNDARQGMLLDLVKKGEAVGEGQTVVTSGNDRFPAGLPIGTVRSVDVHSTTLFAVVRLSPFGDSIHARVLIIRP